MTFPSTIGEPKVAAIVATAKKAEHAVWMFDRLKARGVKGELLTLQGAGHGFKVEGAQMAEKGDAGFFAKHLKS